MSVPTVDPLVLLDEAQATQRWLEQEMARREAAYHQAVGELNATIRMKTEECAALRADLAIRERQAVPVGELNAYISENNLAVERAGEHCAVVARDLIAALLVREQRRADYLGRCARSAILCLEQAARGMREILDSIERMDAEIADAHRADK